MLQIYEKERRIKEEKEKIEKEKRNIDLVILSNKYQEEKNKIEEKKRKEYYKSILDLQTKEKDQEKLKKYAMDEKEKILNGQLIRKIEKNEEYDFKGIPGVYKSISPLRSSLSRGYQTSALPHEYTYNSMRNENKLCYPEDKQKLSYENGLEKHNPITNPVGDISPSQSQKNFYRGRGLSNLKL